MPRRKHPLLALTTVASAFLLMVGLAGPATAETPELVEPVDAIDVSNLFTIDSPTIREIPSRGDYGRAIVTLPATFTRFTDGRLAKPNASRHPNSCATSAGHQAETG